MYIHMHTMAKTIMIANEVYDKLKEIKEHRNESFSEVILDIIEGKKEKTVGNLLKNCLGILEGDTEYDEVMKEARKGWDRWNKRKYV